MAFTSFVDIERIEGLAKVSLKRIKEYIDRQQYAEAELPGIESASNIHHEDRIGKTKSTRPKRKNGTVKAEIPSEPLFPVKELVS